MDAIVFGDDVVYCIGKHCGEQVIIDPIVRVWSADADDILLCHADCRRIG
jgi:hypothetical protein